MDFYVILRSSKIQLGKSYYIYTMGTVDKYENLENEGVKVIIDKLKVEE